MSESSNSLVKEPLGDLEIRRAASDDAQLLSVLAATTFYEAYFVQDGPHNLAAYITASFGIETIADDLSRPNILFFIAYCSGKAVGYAKLDTASRDLSILAGKTIELKRLYTVERVWGRNVGEPLLLHCEAFAVELGCASIWLSVWQENERGKRFYDKHGFVKRGTLEFPYGDVVGINDVMEKPLA